MGVSLVMEPLTLPCWAGASTGELERRDWGWTGLGRAVALNSWHLCWVWKWTWVGQVELGLSTSWQVPGMGPGHVRLDYSTS